MTQLNPTSTARAFLLPLVLGTLTAQVLAGDLYVDDDYQQCPGAGYSSIQDAVDDAMSGSVIYVYPGTYTGTGDEVVKIDKPVDLLAKNGSGEVIIDGQNLRRCLTLMGKDADTYPDIEIRNFKIVNGQARMGLAPNSEHGGGVYAEGLVELSYCEIINCESDGNGGGIAAFNPELYSTTTTTTGKDPNPYTLINLLETSIEHCIAGGDGGGIWNWESNVNSVGSKIDLNGAYGRGGGLAAHHWYTHNGRTRLAANGSKKTQVWGNTAEGDGGGVFAEGNKGVLEFEGTDVASNRALAGDGGGICLFNAVAHLGTLSLAQNDADRGSTGGLGGKGGGIAAKSSSLKPDLWQPPSLLFLENTADSGGAGLYAKDCDLELVSAQFEGNLTLGKGGGMAIISCPGLALDQITFLENIGRVAGGLYIKNTYGTLTDSSVLYNQGFFNGGMNGAGVVVDGGSAELVISGTNFWQNTKKHYLEGNGGVVTDGLGNVVQP